MIEKWKKGPVAFIECTQEIPCNPCEGACPHQAIYIGNPITNLPQLDTDKCIGCGLCIPACPGLAIFKIDINYSENTALLEFPYEYYPLPIEGQIIPCANKLGQYVTMGKVIKIKNPKAYDDTTVITVEVPKEYCLIIRTIYRKGEFSNV